MSAPHDRKVVFEGTGVHTGEPCAATVTLSESPTGILFEVEGAVLPACTDTIEDGTMATTLGRDRVKVRTVEHLMVALWATGITDATVTMTGPELPFLDGAAAEFFAGLKVIAPKEASPPFVKFGSSVKVELGESTGTFTLVETPEEAAISVHLDYPPPLGNSSFTFHPATDDFEKEIAPARTFVLEKDLPMIFAAGLGKGGSLENTVVFGKDGPLNPEGLRFSREPARHKILDALGDLFLLGGFPLGKVNLVRPGHRLVHLLAAELAKGPKP